MSSRKGDRQLDTLFYEALRPAARVEAPPDAWKRLARWLDPVSESDANAVQHLVRWFERSPLAQVLYGHTLRPPVWRKVVSYLHGFHTLYPPSTTNLVSRESNRGFFPSSFMGVAAKQVLDLRLAS